MQFKKFSENQQLYDCHVERIFSMLGVQDNRRLKPGEVIFAVEDQMIGTKHKGRRPSKHAAFWKYFLSKAKARGITIVELSEWYSSQACCFCFKHIQHDPKRHDRVNHCKRCDRFVHRDISSAIIHLYILMSEVEGACRAGTDSSWKPTHSRVYSETDTVNFYRPKIFLNDKYLKAVRVNIKDETSGQNAASSETSLDSLMTGQSSKIFSQ